MSGLAAAQKLFPMLTALLLVSCATPPVYPPGTECRAQAFVIVDDFPGARRGRCTVLGASHVRLEIVPEDAAVSNPSPWFAFQVMPRTSGTALIELDYGTWPHRYVPKQSRDGRSWQALPETAVTTTGDEHRTRLRLRLGAEPVRVAAQELVTAGDALAWSRELAGRSDATLAILGDSAEGRPIAMLESGSALDKLVLLVGRQHPPEVSGAIAMRSFLETLYADTDLANEFRRRVGIIAIPMLNPDGVERGHWRHNTGATDLNRDWGPFTQAETRHIDGLLDSLDVRGRDLLAFMDFHSTNRNLFYTQTDADVTDPPEFTQKLLERAGARLPGYAFTREPRPLSETATAKNYLYRRYGIPSMTYEVDDEASRAEVERAAAVFAEETMRLLLEHLDARPGEGGA